MGRARLGVGVAVVNRLLYAVGGFDGARRTASVENYHPENNCWTELAHMKYARSGAGQIYYYTEITFIIIYSYKLRNRLDVIYLNIMSDKDHYVKLVLFEVPCSYRWRWQLIFFI